LCSNVFTQTKRLYSSDEKKENGRGESNLFESEQKLWNDFLKYNQRQQNEPDAPSLTAQLTHIDNETNLPKQVDISSKRPKKPDEEHRVRVACASGYIQLSKQTFQALAENKLKKGNALIVAQLAGIQASKQTAQLIPLCHQLLLDVCEVTFKLNEVDFQVKCEATCKTSSSHTGVEMEALTACSVALLTIYDMCKAIQKDAYINEIKLEYKYGGKSDFKR
jgi:molybdenum cofactor biosynthesis protein MoaC